MTAATNVIAIAHSNIPNLLRLFLRYWSCDASAAQSRDAIQACVEVWSNRLEDSSAAVTVGVILESFEVAYALKWYVLRKIDRAFMRGSTHPREEPEWFAVVGAIGLLLVVSGVAGEWAFEGNFQTLGES